MFDEELPAKKPESEFPRNLDNMSVHDLDLYIEDLKAEIRRVEADRDQKKASRDAANSVFK